MKKILLEDEQVDEEEEERTVHEDQNIETESAWPGHSFVSAGDIQRKHTHKRNQLT